MRFHSYIDLHFVGWESYAWKGGKQRGKYPLTIYLSWIATITNCNQLSLTLLLTVIQLHDSVPPNWRFGSIQQSNCWIIIWSRQPSNKGAEGMCDKKKECALCERNCILCSFLSWLFNVCFSWRSQPFKGFQGLALFVLLQPL